MVIGFSLHYAADRCASSFRPLPAPQKRLSRDTPHEQKRIKGHLFTPPLPGVVSGRDEMRFGVRSLSRAACRQTKTDQKNPKPISTAFTVSLPGPGSVDSARCRKQKSQRHTGRGDKTAPVEALHDFSPRDRDPDAVRLMVMLLSRR